MVVKYSKTKKDCEHLLGKFLDETTYTEVVDYDCDFFDKSSCDVNCEKKCEDCSSLIDEKHVIFVYRKNFFTEEEQNVLLDSLAGGATASDNRGIACGFKSEFHGNRKRYRKYQQDIMKLLSSDKFEENQIHNLLNEKLDWDSNRSKVWKIAECTENNFDFDRDILDVMKLNYEDRIEKIKKIKTYISNTTYGSFVNSGVIGTLDRNARIPYGRLTPYTIKYYDKIKGAFPILKKLSDAFKLFLPNRYNFQKDCALKIDEKFVIPETVFTTITVNKSFRTAAHRDFGDLHEGFSNLVVLAKNKNYSGGYLILPEYEVAVNIRPGDLLLINNHFGIHGNSEIIKHDEDADRYSIVCYFRENILKLGSYDYETCRKEFYSNTKKVGYDLFESQEWYDFCEKSLGREVLLKYHPKCVNESKINLENFL